MNQQWNKGLSLSEEIINQCQKIGEVDILVGVLCKDVETTVLNVLNVVNEGLYRYFPNYKRAIVVCDGNSSDNTIDAVKLFQPYHGIQKIVTSDIISGGKGAGVMTVFEVAHELNSKCVVLVDGDLLSVKPHWIESMANPVIYGRADLTVPYYIRHKYDGVITNNLVYPFTRALYGIDIRQPIAGEFCLSQNLYELLRDHPLFPMHFGVDIMITSTTAAEGLKAKESLFGLKIHESTSHYLDPEEFLIPMFRRVTSSMFELAKYNEEYWRNRPPVHHPKLSRKSFSRKPVPVSIDVDSMKKSFIESADGNHNLMCQVLPEQLAEDVTKIISNGGVDFDAETWAEVVFNYATAFKHLQTDESKEKLIDSLKTLWEGRFVSYVLETKDMDMNEAEEVIQKQAEIFEEKFEYLVSIYSD